MTTEGTPAATSAATAGAAGRIVGHGVPAVAMVALVLLAVATAWGRCWASGLVAPAVGDPATALTQWLNALDASADDVERQGGKPDHSWHPADDDVNRLRQAQDLLAIDDARGAWAIVQPLLSFVLPEFAGEVDARWRIAVLLLGAEALGRLSEPDLASELLSRAAEAVDAAGLDKAHPLRGSVHRERAQLAFAAGDPRAGQRHLQHALIAHGLHQVVRQANGSDQSEGKPIAAANPDWRPPNEVATDSGASLRRLTGSGRDAGAHQPKTGSVHAASMVIPSPDGSIASDVVRTAAVAARDASQRGRFAESTAFLDAAQRALEAAADRVRPIDMVTYLNARMHQAWVEGNTWAAEYWLQALQERARATLHPRAPMHTELLNESALVQLQKRNTTAAIAVLLEGIARIEESGQSASLLQAHMLMNLGATYFAESRWADAEDATRRAIDALTARSGETSDLIITATHNLAAILQKQGKDDAALDVQVRVLTLVENLHGARSRMMGKALCNTAVTHQSLGDLEAACALLERGLDILFDYYDLTHPDILGFVGSYGTVLVDTGRHAEAERLLSNLLNQTDVLRARVIGDPRDRARFSSALALPVTAVELAGLHAGAGRGHEAFDVLERGRARSLMDLLWSGEVDRVEELRRQASPEIVEALERELADAQDLAHLRHGLAAVVTHRPALPWPAAAGAASDGVARAIISAAARFEGKNRDRLVELLSDIWPTSRALTSRELQDRLALDEGLLMYGWGRRSVIGVLVVGGRNSVVRAFSVAADRAEMLALRSRIDALEASLSQPRIRLRGRTAPTAVETIRVASEHDRTWERFARELGTQLIPDSIRHDVHQLRLLVVCPDGPIARVPFSVLDVNPDRPRETRAFPPAGSTSHAALHPIIDTPIDVVFAPSGTVFAALRERGRSLPAATMRSASVVPNEDASTAERPRALIVADPDFTMSRAATIPARMPSAGGRLAADVHVQPAAASATDEASHPEPTRPETDRLVGHVPLPGAAREADALADLLSEAGWEVALLRGASATLEELERIASGQTVLHFATHGFSAQLGAPFSAGLLLAPSSAHDGARLASNASQPADPAPIPEDADEAMSEDAALTLDHLLQHWRGRLPACQLVVLSACETGVARTIGDSPFSLPVGFFFAGCPTVVASRWPVDDESNAAFMTHFYAEIMRDRLADVAGALRRAQQSHRKAYPHPFYWAAFSVSGAVE